MSLRSNTNIASFFAQKPLSSFKQVLPQTNATVSIDAQKSPLFSFHNLDSYTESLTAADSRVRDMYFAAETADMAGNNVFQQLALSVLSQSTGVASDRSADSAIAII